MSLEMVARPSTDAIVETRGTGRRPAEPLIRMQSQLCRFGPRKEPERNEGGSEAGRDVHRRSRAHVQAGGVARARMSEAEPAASAERQRDLSVVHAPGQDEVECSRWEKVEHVREVTEQDAQVCRVVDQAPRLGTTLAVRARVDADKLKTPPAHVDGLGLVHP